MLQIAVGVDTRSQLGALKYGCAAGRLERPRSQNNCDVVAPRPCAIVHGAVNVANGSCADSPSPHRLMEGRMLL